MKSKKNQLVCFFLATIAFVLLANVKTKLGNRKKVVWDSADKIEAEATDSKALQNNTSTQKGKPHNGTPQANKPVRQPNTNRPTSKGKTDNSRPSNSRLSNGLSESNNLLNAPKLEFQGIRPDNAKTEQQGKQTQPPATVRTVGRPRPVNTLTEQQGKQTQPPATVRTVGRPRPVNTLTEQQGKQTQPPATVRTVGRPRPVNTLTEQLESSSIIKIQNSTVARNPTVTHLETRKSVLTNSVVDNSSVNNNTAPTNNNNTDPNNTIPSNNTNNTIPSNQNQREYFPVTYVRQLSPAGKAALEAQESGDYEYQALLNAGFETPKIVSPIVTHYETNVMSPKNIQHLWHPLGPAGDANLWQNVEFHKFGHNVLESHKYNTPAKFTMDQFGDTVVHAPSDSSMRIIKRTPTITSYSNFLDLEDENALLFDNLEGGLELDE